MKNLTNKTKIILFASLIAAMIIPFSGMISAEAEIGITPTEISDEKYNYLAEATAQTGQWEVKKTNGEYTEVWKYDVKENQNKKHVKLNLQAFDANGNQVADKHIKFKVNYDAETDTYEVDNEVLKETKKFKKSNGNTLTNSDTVITVDSSNFAQINGLIIPGTPTAVQVSWRNVVVDSGNEFESDEQTNTCEGNWYTDFQTNGNSGLRHYDYQGEYYFLDWCIFGNSFNNVQIRALGLNQISNIVNHLHTRNTI